MSAYVVVEIEVTEPVEYETYKKMAPPAIAAYGGKYLARGGKINPLEGDWEPGRLVILEFESLERAVEWWNSPEYAPAKALRQRTSTTRMLALDGIA